MRILLISILLLFPVLVIETDAQTKVSGITFPDSFATGKTKLVFNGGGVKEKYMINMYVIGLYLTDPTTDHNRIIASDTPMSLRLQITSSLVTSKNMVEAVEQGFARSPGGTMILRSRIDDFLNLYNEEVRKGDIYDLIYTPGLGTTIIKNGEIKATIPGADFKEGLFGIWLGNNTPDTTLRSRLLGLPN